MFEKEERTTKGTEISNKAFAWCSLFYQQELFSSSGPIRSHQLSLTRFCLLMKDFVTPLFCFSIYPLRTYVWLCRWRADRKTRWSEKKMRGLEGWEDRIGSQLCGWKCGLKTKARPKSLWDREHVHFTACSWQFWHPPRCCKHSTGKYAKLNKLQHNVLGAVVMEWTHFRELRCGEKR